MCSSHPTSASCAPTCRAGASCAVPPITCRWWWIWSSPETLPAAPRTLDGTSNGDRMHRKSTALALFALMLLPLAGRAATAAKPANDLEARRKALNDLLAEQWEYNLSENPEFASILGDKRWNDKSSEVSDAAVQRDLQKSREFLTRFEAIDTTGFPEQE